MQIQIVARTPERQRRLQRQIESGFMEQATICVVEAGAWLSQRFEELDTLLRGAESQRFIRSWQQTASGGRIRTTDGGIIIIDHNLGSGATANETIPAIRATCGPKLVVAVDTTTTDFDARHLFGDADSLADIAVSARQLASPAFWHGPEGRKTSAAEENEPSYWPGLTGWAKRRVAQSARLLQPGDHEVAHLLRLPRPVDGRLSRRQRATLCPPMSLLEHVMWRRAYLEGAQELTRAERAKLLEMTAKGRPVTQVRASLAVASAAASWLDRWFRLEVIGTQKPLTDLFHMVGTRPRLAQGAGQTADLAALCNQTVRCAPKPPYGLENNAWEGYGGDGIRAAAVGLSPWHTMPMFDEEVLRTLDATTLHTDQQSDPGKELQEMGGSESAGWATGAGGPVYFCHARNRFVQETTARSWLVRPEQAEHQVARISIRTRGMLPKARIEADQKNQRPAR